MRRQHGAITRAQLVERGYSRRGIEHRALDVLPARPGRAALKRLLDRDTFVLTDSALERAFDHIAAGHTPVRFTRAQVRFDPAHVELTLRAVARRHR